MITSDINLKCFDHFPQHVRAHAHRLSVTFSVLSLYASDFLFSLISFFMFFLVCFHLFLASLCLLLFIVLLLLFPLQLSSYSQSSPICNLISQAALRSAISFLISFYLENSLFHAILSTNFSLFLFSKLAVHSSTLHISFYCCSIYKWGEAVIISSFHFHSVLLGA